MITIEVNKGDLKAFKKIIKLAKRDGYYKACGNPDNPWVILKFETKEAFLTWLYIASL